ncbi:calmodulin-like isoform X2 [Symsagittifera roscoffensis]|uniref:calmodulin-like isoform X2 n=1 Tax=Symsagittifera roscoffensis TaxID=84072 RepID=UPI00307B13DA
MSRTPTIHFNPHHYTDEETSVEQIVQLYDIFRSADKNKCGRVPIGSLYISLLDKIDGSNLIMIVRDLKRKGDKQGLIDFDTFVPIAKNKITEAPNCNDDLEKTLRTLGEQITDLDAEDMVKMADLDGDGIVSFEDYREFMASLEGIDWNEE